METSFPHLSASILGFTNLPCCHKRGAAKPVQHKHPAMQVQDAEHTMVKEGSNIPLAEHRSATMGELQG